MIIEEVKKTTAALEVIGIPKRLKKVENKLVLISKDGGRKGGMYGISTAIPGKETDPIWTADKPSYSTTATANALYLKLTAANQTLTGNLAITGTLGAGAITTTEQFHVRDVIAPAGANDLLYYDIPLIQFGTDDNFVWSGLPFRMYWSNADIGYNGIVFDDGAGNNLDLYIRTLYATSIYTTGVLSAGAITGTSSAQLLDTAGLILKGATYKITLKGTTGASNKVITVPNTTGTLALIGDLSSYLPLAGGTMVGNLIFTDNTYDIGASGATRPRHLYLSGNAVIAGTLGAGAATVTSLDAGSGIIKSTGDIKNLTGATNQAVLTHDASGGGLNIYNSSGTLRTVFNLQNANTPAFYLQGSGMFFGGVAGSSGSVLSYNSSGYFGIEGVTSTANIGASLSYYKIMSWVGGQMAHGTNVYASQANSVAAPSIQLSTYVSNAAYIGHLIKLAATPSGDAIQVQSSAAAVLANISATGSIGIGAASTTTSKVHISGLPTAAAGLATGDVWSNSGVLTIV